MTIFVNEYGPEPFGSVRSWFLHKWIELSAIKYPQHRFVLHSPLLRHVPAPIENLSYHTSAAKPGLISRIRPEAALHTVIKNYRPHIILQTGGGYLNKTEIPQFVFPSADQKKRKDPPPEAKRVIGTEEASFFTGTAHTFFYEEAMEGVVPEPNWELSEQLRHDFTQGSIYYLLPARGLSLEKVIQVLKAFSLYQQWQQSRVRLVICGAPVEGMDSLQDRLFTYKYRHLVQLTHEQHPEFSLEKQAMAAYAFILPHTWQAAWYQNLALQARAPIIGSRPMHNPSAAFALMQVDCAHPQALSSALRDLYKNENRRESMASQGGANAMAQAAPLDLKLFI